MEISSPISPGHPSLEDLPSVSCFDEIEDLL